MNRSETQNQTLEYVYVRKRKHSRADVFMLSDCTDETAATIEIDVLHRERTSPSRASVHKRRGAQFVIYDNFHDEL